MSKTLTEIAKQLKDANKKVQLIYAFNGSGKTRLSREFKKLISPKIDDLENADEVENFDEIRQTRNKILYYNAHTEDLFYWDNDLEFDAEPKLIIQPNSFTDWILKDQGLDRRIIDNFQKFANSSVKPEFNIEQSNISFRISEMNKFTDDQGSDLADSDGNNLVFHSLENIKISKGEESNFIWSIFYTLFDEVINILKEPDKNKRDDNQFDELEYVFIDDPVSSLDDNHLIDLAVSLAKLIKSSTYEDGKGVKFIISTHNPLFYNVLYNEFNNDLSGKKSDVNIGKIYKKEQSAKYILKKHADGTFQIIDSGVNDRPFSYHLFLLSELRKLQGIEQVEKYHFNFLRNILEKTATFLGYKQWNELLQKLPEDDRDVMNRMLNLYSHSAHAGEEVTDLQDKDKEKFIKLIKDFTQMYGFSELREDTNARAN